MAGLTNTDLTAYKRALRADPAARTEMRKAALSKRDWTAAMQAIEDRHEREVTAVITDTSAATKATISDALARQLMRVWMERKVREGK